MDKKYTVAIIGCGGRGARTYGKIMLDEFPEHYKIEALCDINTEVLSLQGKILHVPEENRFPDEREFFRKKRADLLLICTQDQDHVRMTLTGLSLGYDILVEKPIAATRDECQKLLDAQKKFGGKVLVGHVLRYAPAFRKAEELLRAGAVGKLIAIDDLEQVWYGHQAHSYVRGNWRRDDESTPMIMAKCCHDLDILQYYAGSRCKSLSSTGCLTWFKPENAPEGAADRCLDCRYVETCPYSAKRLYLYRFRNKPGYVFAGIITYPNPLNEEEILKALRNGPYGRCVYRCDNNVVDHQMTVMTFENGVTASLTMTAFTGNGGRILRLHGSLGEIIIDEEQSTITLKEYGKESQIWSVNDLASKGIEGHGGGDYCIVSGIYRILDGDEEARTSLESAVESHLMAIAAEESRLANGKLVYIHSPADN